MLGERLRESRWLYKVDALARCVKTQAGQPSCGHNDRRSCLLLLKGKKGSEPLTDCCWYGKGNKGDVCVLGRSEMQCERYGTMQVEVCGFGRIAGIGASRFRCAEVVAA